MTVLLLCAALALPGVLAGQAMGRLQLTVKDSAGDPIEGAKVSTICLELPSYSEQQETNRKGRALLAFTDATRLYQLTIEKEGYASAEITIKPTVGSTQIEELTLPPASAAAQVAGVTTSMAVFSVAETLFNEGVERMHAGDLEQAAARIGQALEKDADLAAAHGALARIQLERGQPAEALASAQALVALEPENPSGYRLLYDAYRGTGDETAAADALAKLGELSAGGDTAALIYNEGAEALRMGDAETARARFDQALQQEPEMVPALAALAVLNMRQEEWQQAADLAGRILTVEPGNTKAMQIQVDAYRMLGEDDKAAEARDQLAAVDPTTSASIIFNEAVAHFNEGSMQQATDGFTRALSLDDSLIRAHYYLGLAHTNRQEQGLARDHLQQFVAGAPEDPDAGLAREMLQHLAAE